MKQIYPLVFIVFLFVSLSMKPEKKTTNSNLAFVNNIHSSELSIDISQIFIKPNPVKNELFLQLPNNTKPYKIEIYNIFGTLTKTTLPLETPINVKSLLTGIYYLKIYTQEKTITKRFIKN